MEQGRAVVPAYAKVNLALSVGPAEPPRGYHRICSWFACVSLHDEVELSLAGGEHSVEWAADAPVKSPIDWPLEKDLAVRALALMCGAGVVNGASAALRVLKRIPVGGGLGGGSADAAAALVAANRLLGAEHPLRRLREMGAALGSDVAFFVDDESSSRPAIVSGFGESIERVPRVRGELVLIFPPFGCPTGAVYKAFDELGGARLKTDEVRAVVDESVRGGRVVAEKLFNDLAAAACRVEPRLRDLLERFAAAGLPRVHITGSGSTMFVVAGDGTGPKLVDEIMKAAPEVRALSVRLL